MNILEIIAKKRDGKIVSKEEIDFFVMGYTNGEISDYQAAAFIMAMYIRGMTKEETTNLTLAMAKSGDVLNLSDLECVVVDKHSTGGVGDKVTLILIPIVASLGVHIAKMSGRGLGFTGGTIDKLEAIPGYNTNISIDQFKQNVKEVGVSLMGQTLNLAPADKKIYALRSAISCTDSIPLIASSIMSKKIAAGASKIVLDITCGNGAFMKNLQEAKKLTEWMQAIGKIANKETVGIITNMEEPLGYTIGNSLEVIEAVQALQGNVAKDVQEVVEILGAYMLKLAGKGEKIEENKKIIKQQIQNGKAFNKLLELVQKQGGDISFLTNTQKFPKAKYIEKVVAKQSGYIKNLPAEKIGILSRDLGAGRINKEDTIDLSAGIKLYKKVGDYVLEGETLAKIHTNKKEMVKSAVLRLEEIYEIQDKKIEKSKTILEIQE